MTSPDTHGLISQTMESADRTLSPDVPKPPPSRTHCSLTPNSKVYGYADSGLAFICVAYLVEKYEVDDTMRAITDEMLPRSENAVTLRPYCLWETSHHQTKGLNA